MFLKCSFLHCSSCILLVTTFCNDADDNNTICWRTTLQRTPPTPRGGPRPCPSSWKYVSRRPSLSRKITNLKLNLSLYLIFSIIIFRINFYQKLVELHQTAKCYPAEFLQYRDSTYVTEPLISSSITLKISWNIQTFRFPSNLSLKSMLSLNNFFLRIIWTSFSPSTHSSARYPGPPFSVKFLAALRKCPGQAEPLFCLVPTKTTGNRQSCQKYWLLRWNDVQTKKDIALFTIPPSRS